LSASLSSTTRGEFRPPEGFLQLETFRLHIPEANKPANDVSIVFAGSTSIQTHRECKAAPLAGIVRLPVSGGDEGIRAEERVGLADRYL
jgi:hypothetical protein